MLIVSILRMGSRPGVGVGFENAIVILGGTIVQDSLVATEHVDPAMSITLGTVTETVPEGEFEGTEKSTLMLITWLFLYEPGTIC